MTRSGKKAGECLLCPSAAVQAGDRARARARARARNWTWTWGGRTIHGSGAPATSHMRRDVRSLGRRVLLLRGGAKGEPSHVELISHDCGRGCWVRCVFILEEVVGSRSRGFAVADNSHSV